MRYIYLRFLILVLCLPLVGQAVAQISMGGEPWSAVNQLKSATDLPLIDQSFSKDINTMVNPELLAQQVPYSVANNHPSGKLAIQPLPGDEIFLEYFEPFSVAFSPALRISNVGHNFRSNILNDASGFGDSERCNKDINCSQAEDWQTDKRAVCKILYKKSNGNWYICSGALINNTRNDGSPFFLTANHCVSSSAEAESMILYFNYESPTCNGPDGDETQTVSGTSSLATTYRLDFSLVELSEEPPDSYQPYYAGHDPLVSTVTQEMIEPLDFEIYPNPARDRVDICPGNLNIKHYSVEVLELSGKVLYQRVIKNEGKEVSIPLNSSWNGLYLFRLIHENVFLTKKLIIH